LSSQPDYIRRRLDLEAQKRQHLKAAPQGCQCAYCLTAVEVDALFRERLRLERLLVGEPPF
jgi:hypothetical protein